MSLPRLSVRTGFSFRRAYGSPDLAAKRLKDIGVSIACIADDDGTWGHVPWEKAALGAGLEPLFGARLPIPTEGERKPLATALARATGALYRLSSRPPTSAEELADREERSGVVILSGHALTHPDHFDYINIDQRSWFAARQQLDLADKTGKPIILTPFNSYPAPEDRNKYLAWDDSKRTYPDWILAEEELRGAYHFLSDDVYVEAYSATVALGEELKGTRLQKAPLIHVEGDLDSIIEQGRQYRLREGHITDWTPEYQSRLERERAMIAEKKYESYFLVVADLVQYAKQNMLVGPGRGSSAGSLVCYLTQITEVDPLVHNLLFERFIDVSRFDLPDIDIDFSDTKRHLVFEYLAEKYGADNVGRIGNISRLAARSAIAHVSKKFAVPIGETFPVANVLVEHSSGDARYGKGLEDTLTETNPGRKFAENHPSAAEMMSELEHHPSHTSVHAAGVLICHEPIINFCTVRDGIAHVDKAQSEYLNLLKIDALGLTTLGTIEDAGFSSEDLYGLPLNDEKAFKVFNDNKYAGIFQFEGTQQRRVAMMVNVDNFDKISDVTALARPGPLVGGATNDYIEIMAGKKEPFYIHESVKEYVEDTGGVVLFQEQVMRMCFEIGGFDWATVSDIRKAMSGSKGPEYFNRHGEQFIRNAVEKLSIPEEIAKATWRSLTQYGSWSMNRSHTISYGIISYWCAWLKAYHPLKFAAALLRNAKDDDQTLEVLRELEAEGVRVVAFDRERSAEHWQVVDGELLGGFRNLHGFGPVKARNYVEARDTTGLTDKQLAAIEKATVKFTDLRPTHTLWGEYYERPWKFNINGEVKEFANLRDGENACVIMNVKEVDRRDENEAIRIQRRGKVWQGNSSFLDISGTDDSISRPVICRLRPDMWHPQGELLADRLVKDKDWLLIRGRWLKEFNMMIVKKVKCLTNEDIFENEE